ncbi:MAG: hypothetical protein HY287_11945 [Planctomycetes bacterium]|nr:hypothetical protein [Planctomycetota bacterium]
MTHGPKNTDAITQDEVHRRMAVNLARKDPKVHEGELEIDDNAIVSLGADNGAYVQAWLWVDFASTSLDKEAGDKNEEVSAR